MEYALAEAVSVGRMAVIILETALMIVVLNVCKMDGLCNSYSRAEGIMVCVVCALAFVYGAALGTVLEDGHFPWHKQISGQKGETQREHRQFKCTDSLQLTGPGLNKFEAAP